MFRIILTIFCMIIMVNLQAKNYFIAHRGASYLAPENTLAAVNLAWELGADAVEVDVHLSTDGRVMVIHDKSTRRTSTIGKKLIVAESSSEALRKLDVGASKGQDFKGEKIPFIEEILATIPPDKILYIEIKCGPEVLPALQKAVLESGKSEQLVFISFSWNTILLTQNVFPNNSCYYLRMNPLGLQRKIKQVAQTQLAGVSLYHRIITPSIMQLSEEHQLEVLAWTINNPKHVRRLNRLGINKITTDRPQWLKDEN